MIRRIAKYQTSDGQEFESETAAREHENHATAMKELQTLLAVSVATNRAESVLLHMLEEAEPVMDILRSYRKCIPKALAKAA